MRIRFQQGKSQMITTKDLKFYLQMECAQVNINFRKVIDCYTNFEKLSQENDSSLEHKQKQLLRSLASFTERANSYIETKKLYKHKIKFYKKMKKMFNFFVNKVKDSISIRVYSSDRVIVAKSIHYSIKLEKFTHEIESWLNS